MSRRQSLIEIALIFVVFAVQGAWPLPDNNEPYYLGKAIHYWNPDWLAGDFFLESPDAHTVFYFTFGWLSLLLSPTALACAGRIACWLLLAVGWRRLSFAAVPRAWWSILTAALFAGLMDRFHMAGEWVIGSVEAKPFAYALVFFGFEALLKDRWNRGLLFFGAAAAFHVLVGGWTAVAAGLAWWMLKFDGRGFVFRSLRLLWPGILGGLLLSLPGLIPSLALDWGADAEIARQAHLIYVFERLAHHLFLVGMRRELVLRMALLGCFWILLGIWRERLEIDAERRWPLDALRAFVAGAIVIAAVGGAIHLLIPFDAGLAAGLLRYYWFRLLDVALPLGVAIESVAIIAALSGVRPAAGRCWLALAIILAAFHLGDRAIDRIAAAPPRGFRLADYDSWRDACDWIAQSGEIEPDAVFIAPRMSGTFRWFANRRQVAVRKDIPQSAGSIVEWWRRIRDIYEVSPPRRDRRWCRSLAEAGSERLAQLAVRYEVDYVLVERTEPPLDLPVVYSNRAYTIYRLR